jgi:hypothetical protein
MRKKKTAPAAGDVGDRKKISGETEHLLSQNATTLQADRLVAVLHANLQRTAEPALVAKLRAAIARIQAGRKSAP